MRIPRRFQRCLPPCLAVMAGLASGAPIPHSLVRSIDSPATARQAGTQLGYTVAHEGNLAVIASPFDNFGGEDSGVAGVYSAATGALLHLLVNPLPENGSRFGWSAAISGNRVVIGVPGGDSGANDAGIACIFDLSSPTPSVPLHILENPNPAANDRFGTSVAIAGNRVIVGAPLGDSGTGDAGCTYIYELTGATPTLPALQLNHPDPAGRNFGHVVALSGSRLAVGAPQEGGSGDSSRVYLYDLSQPGPATPVLTLADATPATNESFGRALALAGDTLVVAAPQEDTGADNAGIAYVYDLASGTPGIPDLTLPNPAPALNDAFGSSLALSGSRLVVGNPLDDQGGSDSGRIHVFDLGSATPAVPTHVIDNPGPQSNDQFGHSVAITGTRVLTGAHGDNTGVSDSGSAYFFELGSATPAVPVRTINTPSPSSEEEFGNALAIHGAIIAVGAYHDDKGNNSNSGSAFLYDIFHPQPDQPVLTLENPAPATNDYFGGAIAIDGDLVAVAAYQDDTGATNAGTVYIYDRSSGTPTVPVWTIPNPAPNSQDQFGNALALSGNLLVVGAAKNDAGTATDAGSAYVFDLSATSPAVPLAVLDNPSPAAGDLFGYAVALSGSRVAVGSPGNTVNSVAVAGSVHVYEIDSPAPSVPVITIHNPSPGIGDEFGHSVGISGPWLVAGSPYSDHDARDAGRAYAFRLDSATPTAPRHFLGSPDPEPEDYHGISIAISGTRVVIGASEVDFSAEDSGAAYVHELGSANPEVPSALLDPLVHRDGDHFGHTVAIDGINIVVGAPLADGTTFDRGTVHLFDPDPPRPLLQVEQPPGNGLVGGAASVHFGNAPVGASSTVQEIVIRNVGTDTLVLSGIQLLVGDTADFVSVLPSLPRALAVDETAAFSVSFAPLASGSRLGTLRITSNAVSNNPFDIALTGQGLSSSDDTDGDGLNDVVELQLEPLGFDWQVNDEERASLLQSGANAAGLYSGSQLQAMNPGTPLLPRNPDGGNFKLTISAARSPDLMDFELLAMSPSSVTFTPQGKLEFRLLTPGPRDFFRWEPR
jgi:hypothetical protein